MGQLSLLHLYLMQHDIASALELVNSKITPNNNSTNEEELIYGCIIPPQHNNSNINNNNNNGMPQTTFTIENNEQTAWMVQSLATAMFKYFTTSADNSMSRNRISILSPISASNLVLRGYYNSESEEENHSNIFEDATNR